MRFDSPSRRLSVKELLYGFEIVISPRENLFVKLVFPFLIVLCGLAEYFLILGYLGKEEDVKTLLLFLLVLCSFLGVMILYKWIDNLAGEEHILVKGQTLSIKKAIYGFGITQKYDLKHVSNFRTEERKHGFTPFFAGYYRRIVFDYKHDTYGFGTFNDEQEAQSVINELQTHYDFTRRSITPS